MLKTAKIVMKTQDADRMFAGETKAVLDLDGEKKVVMLPQRSSDLTINGLLAITGYRGKLIHKVTRTPNLVIVEVIW
jgi:hypothetical protein